MFANCSNPQCGVPFDYREGRLVRFSKAIVDGQIRANRQRVEHFWLCGSCSELFVLEYDRTAGMRIKPRMSELETRPALSLVTA